MLEALRKILAIPSVSGTPAVQEALQEILRLCEHLGFRTKNCENHLGYAEIGEGKEMVGILCHLDVVPAGSGWTKEPFGGEIIDGKLYGRGVMDDKGPAIAAIYAMKDLLEEGNPFLRRVRIIFGCMEETGEWEDMEYYKAHEEIPDFGFTPDAEFPVIQGEKGILVVRLWMEAKECGFRMIKGGQAHNMVADYAEAVLDDGSKLVAEGISAHGSTPSEGRNAITALMEQAAERECAFARFYMEKIGWSLDGSKLGLGLSDAESGELTWNVGRVEMRGERIELEIDIRYPVTFAEDVVMRKLQKELENTPVKLERIAGQKPVYLERSGAVIQKLMEAYREVTGEEAVPKTIGGGTYARAMDHIVAFGPVFPGRECTEHKKDEWMYVSDLEKAREIYKLGLKKLACEE